MSKVEASVDPDAILRYGHVFLGVNRPVARAWHIGSIICIHLFGQAQDPRKDSEGVGRAIDKERVDKEYRNKVAQAAPKRVLYLTIFAPTAGEIRTEPERIGVQVCLHAFLRICSLLSS